MIHSWTLQRFKSVYDKTTLEMAPLTVFSGINSSGKSTLLQSLLLVTQTLQSNVYSRSVVLNGRVVKLGTFSDIVSEGDETQDITIGFTLGLNTESASRSLRTSTRPYYSSYYFETAEVKNALIECMFSFSVKGIKEQKDVLQLQPKLEESLIRFSNPALRTSTKRTEINIKKNRNPQKRLTQFQLDEASLQISDEATLEYEIVSPTENLRLGRFSTTDWKPAGASLLHFLPEKISVVFDAVDDEAKRILRLLTDERGFLERELFYELDANQLFSNELRAIIHDSLVEFADATTREASKRKLLKLAAEWQQNAAIMDVRFFIRDLTSTQREQLFVKLRDRAKEIENAVRAGRNAQYKIAYVPLPRLVDVAVDYTKQYFTGSVKYLGPLRDEPKAVYPLVGSSDTRDVGFKGEHTAAVLELHRNTVVPYVPTDLFRSTNAQFNQSSDTLLNAVLDWLIYMGVANDVETQDRGKLGHELRVRVDGKSLHDLTHVGVGVSQVLPILVSSLLAEPNSTLIFEQPELHLHPRVQTRLADFFISMTMLNKQCIVETHSEYLINRLRYRIVAADGDELVNQIAMYFAEKTDGRTKYRKIKINKYGVIENWPSGFFDESEEISSSILQAAVNKRKKERNNQND